MSSLQRMNEENVNLSIPFINVKGPHLLVTNRIGVLIETKQTDSEEFRDLMVFLDLLMPEIERATLAIVGNG